MPEGQRVARKNVRPFPVLHRHAHFQAHRLQNVALLAVGIVQQRDSRRTVRIVFDGRHLGRDSRLVAPEIDRPVAPRVPAAAMPDVISPWELRPPVRFFDSVSDFSGVCLVISLLSSMVRKRREGVYGLNVFSAILTSCLERFERRRVAFRNRLKNPRNYRFSAYSIIFSPGASFT